MNQECTLSYDRSSYTMLREEWTDSLNVQHSETVILFYSEVLSFMSHIINIKT